MTSKPYGKERKGMFQAIRNRIIKKKIGETMTNEQQHHIQSKDLLFYLYYLDMQDRFNKLVANGLKKEDECKDVKS